MPAPTSASIKNYLRSALITAGPDKFVKRDAQGNAVPGALPDALEDLIDALATGLSAQWSQWQTTQVVTTPAGPGSLP